MPPGGIRLKEENLQAFEGMKKSIILVLGVLIFGCAAEDIQILDQDMRRSQSQLNLIQKENDTLKKEVAALQKKSQEDSSSFQTETQRAQADLQLRIDNLQSEVRILSTGIEEYKDYLKKPAREIDRVKEDVAVRTRILEERGKAFEEKNRILEDRINVYGEKNKAIEDRLKGLEIKIAELVAKTAELSSKLAEAEKAAVAREPQREPPAEVKGVSTNVADLYKDAYETFQKGNAEGARRKFEAFLKQYPNTELSDNAQFWIGETYYLKKDFEKAILEYEKAIVKYPEGDKIPAALFKQALAFLELGDKTNARNLLKRVMERYPQSEQAEMAKKRLDTIK
jgi:tol-pal system protein YbgF